MATKLYFQNAAAPYSPATFKGAWDDTGGFVSKMLGDRPDWNVGSTLVSRAETSTNTEWDVGLLRAVSGPLTAQTISGTVNLMIAVCQGSANILFYTHLYIYVTQGDSDLVRGTLLGDTRDTTQWGWSAGLVTGNPRPFGTPPTLSSVATSSGDRIVVELGYVAKNNVSTSYSGGAYYGGSNNPNHDIESGNSQIYGAPYITFSGTITFESQSNRLTRAVTRSLSQLSSSDVRFSRIVVRTLSPEWNSPVVVTRLVVRTLSVQPSAPAAGGQPLQFRRRAWRGMH